MKIILGLHHEIAKRFNETKYLLEQVTPQDVKEIIRLYEELK